MFEKRRAVGQNYNRMEECHRKSPGWMLQDFISVEHCTIVPVVSDDFLEIGITWTVRCLRQWYPLVFLHH